MMNEKWEHWYPEDIILHSFYITSVTDDSDGLEIALSQEKSKKNPWVKIIFPGSARSYTLIQGAFVTDFRNELIQEYGGEFFNGSSCFKVHNSHYIEWASAQSISLITHLHAQHFFIFTPDIMVHAITALEPIVKFLIQKEQL